MTLTTRFPVVSRNTQISFSVSVVGMPSVPQISVPFGFVQFFDSLNGGAAQPLGSPQFLTVGNGGNPTFTLPAVLAPGSHVATAQYLGSNDWAPMFSNGVNITVQ